MPINSSETGEVLRYGVLAISGLLAATFLWAACTDVAPDNAEESSANERDDCKSSAQNSIETGEPVRQVAPPDRALVVVRDIAAWWQDCGCSGTDIGGVSRFASAAKEPQDVTYLFVGRTVLPYVAGNSGDKVVRESAPWFEQAAARVFRELGNVLWLPDALERELLLESKEVVLQEYVVRNNEVTWAKMTMHCDQDWIIIEQLEKRLPLPARKRRARDIGIIGLWGDSVATPFYSDRLSTVMPIIDRFPEAQEEAEAELKGKSNSVIAYWRQAVVRSFRKDEKLEGAASQTELTRAHSPLKSTSYVSEERSADVVRVQQDACGRCHEDAFRKWLESRHSSSMATLRSVLKHEDPRCLPCHANRYELREKGGVAMSGYDAVVCLSCHSEEAGAASVMVKTCKPCHTEMTDPHANYEKHLADVCVKPSPTSRQHCPR